MLVNWELFRQQPLGMLGMAMIVLFAILSISHPLLMNTVWDRRRFDPFVGYDTEIDPHPTDPGGAHLLGTDNYGRDVLSQLLYSARISFGVGIMAAGTAVVLSTLLGGYAGYAGGTPDTLAMGVADVFVLLPAPIVLLIVGLVAKVDWRLLGVSYGILTGLGMQAIVIKSHALELRMRPYVEAAHVSGGSKLQIFGRHILPGLLPLAVTHFFLTVVGAVLTEALLTFFSRTTEDLSWGAMIWLAQEGFRRHRLEGQWHAIIPPAIAIMLFCSAFYLVGRSMETVVNPKLRKR
jgi:peptide/nickel transport system permease protein